MKKKNGVNIMLFVFIINLNLILSCTKSTKITEAGVLVQTDNDFSAMSVKEGMFKAFLFYIADDGVILQNNSFPSEGKETLRKHFSGSSDTAFVLSWKPLSEKMSEAGDLGYTYGIFTNTDKSTGKNTRGTYVTIWKKQADGNWKFVLDTGTKGLPEK
jgi:ketosteroid isomerase-like protein